MTEPQKPFSPPMGILIPLPFSFQTFRGEGCLLQDSLRAVFLLSKPTNYEACLDYSVEARERGRALVLRSPGLIHKRNNSSWSFSLVLLTSLLLEKRKTNWFQPLSKVVHVWSLMENFCLPCSNFNFEHSFLSYRSINHISLSHRVGNTK